MEGTSSGQTTAVVEPELGGRWASLRGPRGREWLWSRPEALPARRGVRPGDPFVDAGGLEECFPTIAGAADHGTVWDRPWRVDGGGGVTVEGEDFRLRRRIGNRTDGALEASYRLDAEPGLRFVWAAHAILDLSEEARLVAPAGQPVRLWPEHWRTWPDLDQRDGRWPRPLGRSLDSLGHDGSATFMMLLGLGAITAADGGEAVTFALEAPCQPAAIGIWRNLGGWPPGGPYRSIGIEPAIGWHFDRDRAGAGEVGVVPDGGVVEWTLTVSATA